MNCVFCFFLQEHNIQYNGYNSKINEKGSNKILNKCALQEKLYFRRPNYNPKRAKKSY